MGISVGDKNVLELAVGNALCQKGYEDVSYIFGADGSRISFSYTGSEQSFTIPQDGYYTLECWGAAGGRDNRSNYEGGRGGYAKGRVYLTAGTVLKIYVGGQGKRGQSALTDYAFNGGGRGGFSNYRSINWSNGGGGGGTDIRIGGNTLYHRLIVAGGGGGSSPNRSDNRSTMAGGGEEGNSPVASNKGTQTDGWQFGAGFASNCNGENNYYSANGGGGGWYGGGKNCGYNSSDSWNDTSWYAGGGSGFVRTGQTTVPAGYLVSEDYILDETANIKGSESMPTWDGTGTMTGNAERDGYVVITCPFFIPPKQKITTAGAYHNPDLGLISISSDGENWITMSDKNVGADNVGDNGKTFQFGNNYGFPGDGDSTAITTSSGIPNLNGYEGGNPYSDSNYRTNSSWAGAHTELWRGVAFPDMISLRKGPCPHGFHVPTQTELSNLLTAIGDLIGEDVTMETMENYLLMPHPQVRTGSGSFSTKYVESIYGSIDVELDHDIILFGNRAPGSGGLNQTHNILGFYGLRMYQYNESSTPSVSMSEGLINTSMYIRPFRDKPIVPTTGWTRLPSGQARLPNEYQELTYIYGDGTAHINTGVTASTIKKINMEIGEIAQGSSYADQYSYVVFGTTANSWWMSSTYYTNSGSRFRYHKGNGTRQYDDCNASQTGVRNIIEYQASSFTVNGAAGSNVGTDSSWADASTSPVCFRYCGNNSRSKYRMYYSKITLNDDSEFEFIPCYRKSDGLCGLYCLQNQTFYSNANSSGEFAPGEPVFFENAWEMSEHTRGYWELSSQTTTQDGSGNGHHLTNQNGTQFGTYAGVDCAFFNNNSSSETGIGLYTDGFGMSTDMTVSLWFYPISFPHVHLCQFQFSTGTTGASTLGSWINNNNGTRNICIGGRQGGYETITSGVPEYEGKRHHLVATKKGNDYKLYIDNRLVCTLTYAFNTPDRFWLGQNPCDVSDLYGYMADVIVEDRAWSLGQIKGYNAQSRAKYYEGYRPTDDTVAYYPLNSKTTVKDLAYNCYHFNVNNNITFGEHQGVDCGYGNSANASSGLWRTSGVQIPNANFTWRCWIWKISNSTANPRFCSSYAGNPYGILMNTSGNIVCWSTSNTDGYPIPVGERHQYIITGSFSGGSYKLYVDGELVKTWSGSGYSNGAGLSVFGHDNQGSSSDTSDKFNGYLSEWLLEQRQRTAEEALKDFESMKANYGFL